MGRKKAEPSVLEMFTDNGMNKKLDDILEEIHAIKENTLKLAICVSTLKGNSDRNTALLEKIMMDGEKASEKEQYYARVLKCALGFEEEEE